MQFFLQNYTRLLQEFSPHKVLSFPDCFVVLDGRILARNLPWNWSVKFHLSRLREGLLPAKEVIWITYCTPISFASVGELLRNCTASIKNHLPESTIFFLLKQTHLLLDIQLSIYASICLSQLYASIVVCALFKIITIRAALWESLN